MATLEISKFEQWVTEIAEEYRRKGYEVITQPSDEHLPDFLIPFKPDLIAQSPLENVAVRVQASGRVKRTDSLTELAEVIEAHPGWRLDLAIERPQARETPEPDKPRIEKAVIRQRLQEGEQLGIRGCWTRLCLLSGLPWRLLVGGHFARRTSGLKGIRLPLM